MRIQESNRLGVAQESVRSDIQPHLDWLDQHIQSLIKAINDSIDSNPELKVKRE